MNRLSKISFLFSVICFFTINLNAQTYILNGKDFSNSSNNIVLSDQFYPNPIPNNYNVLSQYVDITLSFVHDNKTLISSNFDFNIDIDIDLVDINGNTNSISKNLAVDFDPNPGKKYKDLHKIRLKDIRHLTALIKGVNHSGAIPLKDIEHMFYLEFQIIDEYLYDFNGNVPNNIISKHQAYSNELVVNWDMDQSAIAYDVEWTFVSNDNGDGGFISSSDLKYSFRNNASRVTTKNNFYEIPLIYEAGWIVYRVRSLGKLEENGILYTIPGNWSLTDAGNVNQINDKFLFNGHETLLNWQSSLIFADEGKRKVVITYSDGLLKNRQVLSHKKSLDKSIIGETIYDFEGNPALSILPVPIESSSLEFQHNFNTYNNQSVSAKDFDVNKSDCYPHSIALDNTSGAAKYYSPNNNSQSIFKESIDDAKGYPYIQTQYTPDHTGRISKISLLGKKHAIDKGHAIENYYETVSNNRIQRIFGSEVGASKHYTRNITRDANGQYFATYFDLKDNVVATSIIGEAPTNLIELDSSSYLDNRFSEIISEELIPYNNLPDKSLTLNVIKNIVQPFSSDYFLSYELKAPYYENTCLPNPCLECVYEIDINFIDECANVLDEIDQNHILGNTISSSTCNDKQHNLFPFGKNKITLNEGRYTLNKSLKVNQESIDYFAEYYLKNNTCLKTYNDFLLEELNKLDFSLCNISCCGDSTLDLKQIIVDLDYQTSLQTSTCANDTLDNELDEILQLCQKTVSICSNTIEIMKADFYPGGQYALYQTNYTSQDPTSIFSSNSLTVSYDNPNINYLDEYGNPALINGLRPQDLTIKDFITYFEVSWADALVKYHPEYCYTKFCDHISLSDNYNSQIISIDLHQDAQNYIQSIQSISQGLNLSQLAQYEDPVWNILPTNYKSLLSDKVLSYTQINNQNIDMWTLSSQMTDKMLPANTSINDKLNIQWSIFRSLYIGAKTEILEQYRTSYLLDINCCNDCIDNVKFTNNDVCCKSSSSLNVLVECCKINNPCACNLKYSFFKSKKKRFLTFKDAFDLAGYDFSDLNSLQNIANAETQNNCCDKLKMPQTPPVKLGMLSEDNNWIAVQGDDGKVTNKQKIKLHWECNLSPPHCENTILMHKAYQNPCVDDLVSVAQSNSNIRYQNYLKNEKEKFINDYVSTCLNVQESLVQKKNEKEYHYMLYYHDQANNLVMTVPPKAVDPLNQIQDAPKFNDINKNIQNGQHQIIHPDHNFKLASFIKYNSLNNPISVSTPDGGLTYFWYDNLGRNILSQNSEQRKEIKFSYTVFDNLNRVVEVGEIKKNAYLNVTKGKNKNNKDLFYKNYQKICQAQNGLNQFLSTGVKSQIKRTYYDTKFSSLISNQFTGGQKNLRNRVSGSTIDHNGDGVYEHGLFYSYDISGNLCEFLQHYNDMPSSISSMHEFKKIIYRYDLTSNKLIQVLYQEGQQDQFYHKYVYDEENKLIEIYTSRDGIIWKNDSRYFYYDHGPLSRQELGDQNVQGIDYAYNINGWIKGVNSTSLNPKIDIGKDALSASSNLNKVVAKDAFSYSLSYYNQDYSPIGPSYWLADITNSPLDKNELFDGNIRHMTTSLKPFMNQGGSFATIYQYDQLNRLKSMSSFQGLDSNINRWNNNNTGVYKAYNSLYEYDPAGNIAHLSRRNFDGKLMDDLFYDYYLNTNQLSYVTDKAGKFGNDIGNQSSLNYSYDENGNLIADNSKNINKIFWNQYGKIQRIERSNNDEDFYYNSLNNLVSKKTLNNHFYYARDPFGLLVASYEYDNQTKTLILKEHIIYADNRIGVDQSGIILDGNNLKDYQYVRANKQFELNNHLQNNLVTISDKKIQIPDNNVFSCYSADVLTARDYYPFGSEMFNRTYILDKEYKYGFNGKISENHSLNDDNYDFGSRIYNSQIAKFFSMDPLSNNFPANTPYSFANNMPIRCIDVNGMYPDPGDSDHKRKMHAKKTDRRIREYLSERGYEVNSKRLLTFNTGIWTNRGSIKVKDDDPWYNFWEGDFFTLYESKRVHENIGGWTNRWFRVGSNGNGVWDKESSLDGKYFNSGNPVTWKGVEDAANAYGVFFGAIATVASFGTSNLTLGAINAVFELTMMLNSADDIHKSTTGNSYLEKMGVSEEKVKQVKDILFIASITKAASEMGITLTKIQHNVSPKDILKRIKPEKRKKVIALAIKHLKKYIKEDGTDIGLDIIKISPNAAGKFGTKNSNDED